MRSKAVLAAVTKMLAGLRLGGKRGDERLVALDRGVLTVALMVAAVDGQILPTEYEAFWSLSAQCRGATRRNVRLVLDSALRRAGYLMVMAQVGVYSERERVLAFVQQATEALPCGFSAGSVVDVRRAFAIWVAMAISDGTYSPLEHRAIESLQKLYATFGVAQSARPPAAPAHPKMPLLLETEYLARAEKIVRDLSSPSKCLKAAAALEEMVTETNKEIR